MNFPTTSITDLPVGVIDAPGPVVESPEPGQLVVIPSRGRYRLARVTKVGPKRVTAEYTTPGAIDEAWKIASRSRVARLTGEATHEEKLAARYAAEADVVEALDLATDHLDGDAKWVAWSELPEAYRAVGDRPNNYSGRTMIFSAEQLRAWAVSSRESAAAKRAQLDEAREYDALALDVKARRYVHKTTKNVARADVHEVPAP
jgi:hypothetical protein